MDVQKRKTRPLKVPVKTDSSNNEESGKFGTRQHRKV